MARIALKIDVDTDRGTLEGVPRRLASLFERFGCAGRRFLFSLGPRTRPAGAVKRAFKARLSWGRFDGPSVLKHYGLRTLLYGKRLFASSRTLGAAAAQSCADVATRGFESPVWHTYNHVKWAGPLFAGG